MYFNDLILLDIEAMVGSRVNAVESHLPASVSNSSLSIVGNKCFVFGGTDIKGNCFNDIRSVDISYYLSKNDITVGEGASSDYTFKILIIGDACKLETHDHFRMPTYILIFFVLSVLLYVFLYQAVGKSSLLTRFSDNSFNSKSDPTVGIDFNSRMIRVDRAICKLEIWDTAGYKPSVLLSIYTPI